MNQIVIVGRIFLTNSISFFSDGDVKNFYNEAEALLIESKKENEKKKKRIIKKVVTTIQEVDQDEI